MERYNSPFGAYSERKKMQQRIQELEEENNRLKNRSDFVKDLMALLMNSNRYYVKSQDNGSLEQVIELVKDLSNDLRKFFKGPPT